MLQHVHPKICWWLLWCALSWRSSTLDILLVVLTHWSWAFSLPSIQSSLFSCSQEVHKNSTFLFPKTVIVNLLAGGTLLNFGCHITHFPWCCLHFGSEYWSHVSSFIAVHDWKPVCPQAYLHITSDWFPCFFVFICEHCWCSLSTDLGITKLFIECHYTPFTDL
jgi:hypothetical protein